MKRLRGPELKMPELKAPDFVADLYYDLRDRRLLPLVALVLVAIAAVPFLLGGGEEPYVPPAGEALSALGSPEKTSKLTVVEATPGLRDYRKRLADRSPTDPFKQRYTGLPASAQVQSSGSESEGSGSSTTPVAEGGTTEAEGGATSGGSGPSAGSGKSAGSGTGGGGGQTRAPSLIQIVADVQISHMETTAGGKQKMSEPEVRHRVRPFTQLPGEKVPVVTMMGVSLHTGKAFFLVSNDVRSLDGDFNCITRTPTGLCELLEIAKGMQLDATYGPEKVLYRFKVIDFSVARDGKAGDNRAPRAAFAGAAGGAFPAP
jgi:hypothetical protein